MQLEWKNKILTALNPELNITPTQTPGPMAPGGVPAAAPTHRKVIVPPREETAKLASYIVDKEQSLTKGKLIVKIYIQEKLKNGGLGAHKFVSLSPDMIETFYEPEDQKILFNLIGKSRSEQQPSISTTDWGYEIAPAYLKDFLVDMAETGRLFIQKQRTKALIIQPLNYETSSWNLKMVLSRIDGHYFLRAHVARGPDKIPVSTQIEMVEDLIFDSSSGASGETLSPSDLHQHKSWYLMFKKTQSIEIPADEVNDFLDFYFNLSEQPQLDIPDDLEYRKFQFSPVPRVTFSTQSDGGHVQAKLDFLYGDKSVEPQKPQNYIPELGSKSIFIRSKKVEGDFLKQFHQLSLRYKNLQNSRLSTIYLTQGEFFGSLQTCFDKGWEILADNKKVSQAQNYSLKVTSGVDWFDVETQFQFSGGGQIDFPALLENVKKRNRLVLLKDGSYGLLPQEWADKFLAFTNAEQINKNGFRLTPVQALFFNSFFENDKELTYDNKFSLFKNLLTEINEPTEVKDIDSFKGELRDYQKKGLSWLNVLTSHKIGGVLADDMGLGKTIQALALLTTQQKKQSLVVAPKSLIFNWMNEATRFTPHFKLLNYTGQNRAEHFADFDKYDIIMTTYQTLRADIDKFQDRHFDFFILDEAHYIKNPSSQSFMACKLIKAERKIALTGTPVENSLSDLFSILSIVTPGLVGANLKDKYEKEKNPSALKQLSKALKPFVLRRTKGQVLKDLPEKSENLLYFELNDAERKRYNDLKEFYWGQINGKLKEKSLDRSKIDVLEALLRLRQASCHQGLLDETLTEESSSKFDALIEQLETVIADGHKVLIFSQFTSLLKLLRPHLTKQNWMYEYLDGSTKDRETVVKHFQQNPDVKLFLISLKAGGLGLNLTAADYVYILDPWWNPAAESQAIDRAHRIGQNRKVFAYKMIAKNTVEEKILELQKTKIKIAEAMLGEEQQLIKNLSMDDLKELFS